MIKILWNLSELYSYEDEHYLVDSEIFNQTSIFSSFSILFSNLHFENNSVLFFSKYF